MLRGDIFLAGAGLLLFAKVWSDFMGLVYYRQRMKTYTTLVREGGALIRLAMDRAEPPPLSQRKLQPSIR